MATATRLPREKIFSIAEQASKAFSYTSDFSIERVVDDLGGRIASTDFWENAGATGSLVVAGLRKFQIFIPNYTTPERDRFTIAHELGHYILHYLPNTDPRGTEPFRIERYGDTAIEKEANLFAYGFLMPEDEFARVYDALNGDVSAIASHFRVAETAVKARVKLLRLNGDAAREIRSSSGISAA